MKVLLSISILLLAFPGFAAAIGRNGKKVDEQSGKPNIVFILVDDLDETTTPTWDVLKKTQALIKDRGVTFKNSYAPTPICCAARSSIFTGNYGHNTGVLTNSGDHGGWESFFRNGNEDHTFATWLQAAGYNTGLIGKYMNGIESDPTHVPKGWNTFAVPVDPGLQAYTCYNYTLNENGTLVNYGSSSNDYLTDVVRNKAVDFIDKAEQSDDQPFMLELTPTAVHYPCPPARRDAANPYNDAKAPRTRNYKEKDLRDKPSWLKASYEERGRRIDLFNDFDYQNRMGDLYSVDDMVAAVVKELRDKGELDNTYLVFSSDNGYNLGSHWLNQKMAPYEESVRVPLVIAGPGIRKKTNKNVVLDIDLAPTFADITGTQPSASVDGRSLLPLLKGTARSRQSWRKDFVVQYHSNYAVSNHSPTGVGQVPGETPLIKRYLGIAADIPSYRAVRGSYGGHNYLYVEWYGDLEPEKASHQYELYDITADRYQLHNLLNIDGGKLKRSGLSSARKARLSAALAHMQKRLQKLGNCAGSSC